MAGLGRQDSVGSASSGASGFSAASSMAEGGDGVGGGAAGDLEASQALQKAVFGPLLTLYKERWEDSKRFLVGRVLLEHLQLLLILLQAQFFWTFDTSYWLWDILNYSLLKNLTVPGGYAMYSGVLYVLAAFVVGSMLACGWVAYVFSKNGIVPNKWPVKLLRLLMVVFYKIFYVTALNYFLGALNCSWLVTSNVHYNVDFPNQNCMVMPHMVLMLVAAVAAVLAIAVSGLMSLAEVTPNPASQNWLAAAHSAVEVKTWAFKTAIVISANILVGNQQVQSILLLIAAGWIAYVHLRYQPYLFEWTNHLRTGAWAMTANTALLLTINMFADVEAQQQGYTQQELLAARADRSAQLTLYMFVLLPVALVVGAALSWLRLHLWVRPVVNKFRELALQGNVTAESLKNLHKFPDEYEVELAARCCRCWLDYEDNILDPDATDVAEHVIKGGLARFPTSAHMMLVYINFLSSVKKNLQHCNSQLQVARKLPANWCDSYVFFVREQQQLAALQSHAGQSDSAVDLVGYVEFQRSFKLVLGAHKAALYATRSFWKQLLHSSVQFNVLTKSLARIEACRNTADRTYKTMLERYPSNIKVSRAYARFLEGVCGDPWAASKYFSEADRLEEAEGGENANGDMGLPGMADDAAGGGGEGKAQAICVINAQGIIQMANKPLLKMFGYKQGELEGKNISLLMPQPFSNRHNGFLRNYATTGVPKILDSPREVVALHKDHYVFPLSIFVTKVSGSGADAIFMGVLRPLPEQPDTVKAWITPAGGVMLCVDLRFADWFGLANGECLGKPFSSLAVDPDVLAGLMDEANAASVDDFDAGLVQAHDVLLGHKYGTHVRVDISIHLGGTEAERLYVAVIRQRSPEANEHLMVTDPRGRIMYATTKLANLLGYQHTAYLVKTNFTRYMAQPFMQLHAKWMQDIPDKVPLCSCRNSAPVVLITNQKTPVPATLEISTKEVGDSHIYIVKVHPTPFPAALQDRRLSMRISPQGNVLEISNASPRVFNFRPELLVGRNLSECLDVFRGLPKTGGPQGLDMEHVLARLIQKSVEQKESSWRCGMHPPLTAQEVAAAKANVVQANMLSNQTKAALLQLEVELTDDDDHRIVSISAHVWRAELLTGVLEVDKTQTIVKAGCCPLHQPGPIFGVPSSAMMHKPLHFWLGVPTTYDGLLLEAKKKGGALKKKVADAKTGPLFHVSGQHFDGDRVKVAVQAVVKEGAGAAGRLVVKLTVEEASKGNPNFARRLLGLPELSVSAASTKPAALAILEGLAAGSQPGQGAAAAGPQGGVQGAGWAGQREGDDGGKSMRMRDGVRFGGGQGDGDDQEEEERGGSEGDGPVKKTGKNERMLEWMSQATGVNAAAAEAALDDREEEGQLYPEESLATSAFMGMPLPPAGFGAGGGDFGYTAPPDAIGVGDDMGSKASGDDDGASQQSGSEAGEHQSDFRRGRRMRKLARLLTSKPALKNTFRFYHHTVAVIALLAMAHLTCFVVSVVMLNAQKQYIDEVDDAGIACIAMHRMAIDCRVLDAMYRGTVQPGIFTLDEMDHFVDLLADAIDQFERAHENTYLGRNDLMRRFFNRQRYKLQDYWETPMWSTNSLRNTTPPTYLTSNTSLWAMGNWAILSAREVWHNHKHMAERGQPLSDDPFWYYVIQNAPNSLYQGYKQSLYGLVERALSKVGEVRTLMLILMLLEGCALFIAATVYVCLLVRKMVSQRANIFTVFLVIPTGFLRALASKQVQLEEDDDSDGDSDAGDLGDAGQPPPQQQQRQEKTETQKLNLNLGGKRSSAADARGKQHPGTLLSRISSALNPLKWFAPKDTDDVGKRKLLRSNRDMIVIGGSLLLWGAVITVIYGTSIHTLDEVKGPFQMLNIINFLVFRVTRTVLYSLDTCLAAPNATLVQARQAAVAERVENLRQEYQSLLYGFQAVGGNAVPTDLSNNDSGLFQSTELANYFFRNTQCMRRDQSTCYPDGHKFFISTHSGLDALVTRFIQEALQLVKDSPADVNISSSRLQYIWQAGRFDLFDGMLHADEIFRGGVEGMFSQLRTVHVAVLVISLAWALTMWLALVRPMLRRAGKESRQIAEMLSQLPAEMDVEGLVAQALVKTVDEDEPGLGGSSSLKKLSGAGGNSGRAGTAATAFSLSGGGGGGGGGRSSGRGRGRQQQQQDDGADDMGGSSAAGTDG